MKHSQVYTEYGNICDFCLTLHAIEKCD